jgi:hypothetical protein
MIIPKTNPYVGEKKPKSHATQQMVIYQSLDSTALADKVLVNLLLSTGATAHIG